MSEWKDPDFEAMYKDTNAQEATRDFINVDKLLTSRLATESTFSDEDLKSIQNNFHNLMRYRCSRAEDCLKWLSEQDLPVISNNLLTDKKLQWFPVAGMYGGFSYALFERDGSPVLITESWIRIVGGSGQQHEITPGSVELVVKGFA